MFNTYVGRHTRYLQHVKVTENLAPTDESVRLAEEYREKALASVLARGKEDLGLGFRWHVLDNPICWNLKVMCEFDLLGDTHRFEFGVDVKKFKGEPHDIAIELDKDLKQSFCEKLAEVMSKSVLCSPTSDILSILESRRVAAEGR